MRIYIVIVVWFVGVGVSFGQDTLFYDNSDDNVHVFQFACEGVAALRSRSLVVDSIIVDFFRVPVDVPRYPEFLFFKGLDTMKVKVAYNLYSNLYYENFPFRPGNYQLYVGVEERTGNILTKSEIELPVVNGRDVFKGRLSVDTIIMVQNAFWDWEKQQSIPSYDIEQSITRSASEFVNLSLEEMKFYLVNHDHPNVLLVDNSRNDCTDTIGVGGGVVLWDLSDSVQPIIYVPEDAFCDGVFITGKGQNMLPLHGAMIELVRSADTMQVITRIGNSGFDFVDNLPFKKGRYRLNFRDATSIQKRGGEFLNSEVIENMVLATWWSKKDVKYRYMKDIVFNCFTVGADGLVLEPLGPNEY